MKPLIFTQFILFSFLASQLSGLSGTGIMPLHEVKAGMEGEFRTVVRGSEIRSFPIRIVGVMDHFIGPQRAVIWAEVLDDENLLYGPVSGMSGSPVFIGGRLIGAYAYGYNFAKEQALIGIQPIESMLEISELHPVTEPVLTHPSPLPMAAPDGRSALTRDGWMRGPVETFSAADGEGSLPISGGSGMNLVSGWTRLPMPLMTGGFSPRTLEIFRPHLESMGLNLQGGAVGAALGEVQSSFEPGAPLAGVLMTGDFRAAGVGTVTFRDDNTVFGFGHSFFQHGPTEIPMATAEIVTVVQSVVSSFKMSKLGPVIGSIHQDRLTGIVGEIGREAPMIALQVEVDAAGTVQRSFQGELFQHRQLSPVLAAMVMMESLSSTLEAESEQTVHVTTTIRIREREPIVKRDVATGPGAATRLVMDFLSVTGSLMDNPFDFPRIEGIEFSFELQDRWNQQTLRQVVVESGIVKEGSNLDLRLMMHDYRGGEVSRKIAIPIPDGTANQILEVEIVDAEGANRTWSGSGGGSTYRARPDARGLDDLIREIRERRGFGAIYVRIFRPAAGVRLRGTDLDDLPPSFLASISSPKTAEVMQRSERSLLWEGAFPVSGEFRGTYRFPIEVRH